MDVTSPTERWLNVALREKALAIRAKTFESGDKS